MRHRPEVILPPPKLDSELSAILDSGIPRETLEAKKAATRYTAVVTKKYIRWIKNGLVAFTDQTAFIAVETRPPTANPRDVMDPSRPTAFGRVSDERLEERMDAAIGYAPPDIPVIMRLARKRGKLSANAVNKYPLPIHKRVITKTYCLRTLSDM
jgi:hypothetical protein